ncbi:AGE family epimerase/isomerase [Mucilaginibacter agri]|uniref:Cellobiose 2-epimerase n=1 Tax=Mucilaginibacter agri TaxID=2695265 RepID=A0A965ZHR5_9SPHI|nr:AGE family epimerase/isomerase [Mucilaginibacter agri]NCD70940.1 N-acyl-D-glucosamine 2-epimerase [Mucilaginibacter agri]
MDAKQSTAQLEIYKDELNAELIRIMDYWSRYTVDDTYGGFYGKIDQHNQVDLKAPKGSVLNARILWSFSAAYNQDQTPYYLDLAQRAYDYISKYFIDHEHRGVYWTVDFEGNPLDTKKQVYATAFTIYGLSEYYIASKDESAKQLAMDLYKLLVDKSFDTEQTGYFEAFTRDWQPIEDLRLSEKDANEKKTMNTHLHVLEAYANLYRIWPDGGLLEQILGLLYNFIDHFIGPSKHSLHLFFDENWKLRSDLVSYGHDIEAAWLVLRAAEIIDDELLIAQLRPIAVDIAHATLNGLDKDGGMWYEYEPASKRLISEKHWWVQAEAMIGYFNAWQISGDDNFKTLSLKNWDFVKNKILDQHNGEWHWGVNQHGQIMPNEDKAGLWKCPYHNTRACIEIINRINSLS